MRIKTLFGLILFLSFSLACGIGDALPQNAVTVTVAANTSLTPWLTQAVADFNQSKMETAAGKPIQVTLVSVEAGQAVIDIAADSLTPDLWIPDDAVWVNALAQKGRPAFQPDCTSVAHSPLVIAMWRPVAETLGWPGRSLGWLDIGSLAADESAWAYYSGGQFGPSLRLGHTHPGLSGSGAATLLAVVQAAQSQSAAVSVTDIQQPIVQASVGAFEGAVSWFSPSTLSLGQTMRDRGVTYLGAAVMYENIAVTSGANPALVPIYPFEGTFVATHPACLNASAPVEQQEAAAVFRNYLLGLTGQAMAVANGLRPASSATPTGNLTALGVDLAEPRITFAPPDVDALYAVQSLWQDARKDVNLVLLLDVSGSMREDNKIVAMREAAAQFVAQMGDDDYLTIISISTEPAILMHHTPMNTGRAEAIKIVEAMHAHGETALYDAIGAGAWVIDQTKSSQTSNALVVLTDGKDTASFNYRLDQALIDAAAGNSTTVFTIAYGEDADRDVLEKLANKAGGNFYLGNQANIAAIYEEMSAAFGGSAGIGR